MSNAWTLLVRMQGDVRQMEYALSSVERRMGGLTGAMARSGRNMSAAGRAMTLGVTAPLLAMAGGAIKAAADFETSFASVNKVLSDSDLKEAGMNLEQLSRGLRDLALEVPIEGGVNTLSEIMAQGGALGISVDRLEEFTEVMAKLSLTADDVSPETAATAFGQLNTALGFTEGQILETADAIVHLGNNGASTEGQILSMMGAIGGAAAIVNLTHLQTAAWAASMSNVGEKSQAGGSSISRYFQNASDAIATGNERLTVMADVLGMTRKQVQEAFGRDSNKVLVDFMTRLSKMDKTKWTGILSDMGLGDLLRRRGWTKVLNALREDTEGSLTSMMEALTEAPGAMQTEFEKRAETLHSQLQLIGQTINEYAITVGESLIPIIKTDLLPIIKDVLKVVKEWAEWFKALPPETKKTILQVGLLVVAAGPLLFIFGGIVSFLAGGIGLAKTLVTTLLKLTGLKWLGRALLGLGTGKALPGGNMLGVQKVFVVNMPPGGVGGGGPTVPVAGGGKTGWLQNLAKNAWKAIPVIFAAAMADEFEDEIQGFAVDLRKDIWGDNPPLGFINFDDLQWPFGPKNTPTILPELNQFFGGSNGILGGTGSGRAFGGSWTAEAEKIAKQTRDAQVKLYSKFAETSPVIFDILDKVGLIAPGVERQITETRATKQAFWESFNKLNPTMYGVLAKMGLIPPAIERHIAETRATKQAFWESFNKLNPLAIHMLETLGLLPEEVSTYLPDTSTLEAGARASTQVPPKLPHIVDPLKQPINNVTSAVNSMHGTLRTRNFAGTAVDSYGRNRALTAYDSGAKEIPANQLAFLHKGEMVTPAKEAEALRRGDLASMLSGEGRGGEEHYHLSVNGLLRAETPAELLRPMKYLARGKRLNQPRMDTAHD